MPAKTLMVQGTASSVGKSILVTALCRIFRQDGLRVAPFKSQNMALNSFVTREGGEIGRAQAVQAEAARVEPSVDMNPVLLKPEADARSQVIVLGKVAANLPAREYYRYTPHLLRVVEESLERLRSQYDVVIIEGAGSPAEINLKESEIVNMRVARMTGAPVLLVGDIDRGGVFASIIGTLELLDEEERGFVKGTIINKFRGDVSLLKPGLDFLEKRSGKPVLGVVPFFRGIRIAQEDSVWLEERRDDPSLDTRSGLDVAVIGLPHMSNYDDFDPLDEMGCTVRYVGEIGQMWNPDLIILPGTKTTVLDLNHIRGCGLGAAVARRAAAGTPVIGICGGYQMLGKAINDPLHVESAETSVEGLGLLDIETTFESVKTTTQVRATVVAGGGLLGGLAGVTVSGYEIHMGQTTRHVGAPVFRVVETPDGTASYFDGTARGDGNVFGSYIHGLFHNTAFTHGLLDFLRQRRGVPATAAPDIDRDEQYDALATVVRQSLDMKAVYGIVSGGDKGMR
jgi:adenosylcobyric acid synthase